jgi:hypothetical protein
VGVGFVLQHEAKWTEQAIKFFNEAAQQTGGSQAAAGSLTQQQQDSEGMLLYDRVFEKAPDHRTPACSHVHRWVRRQLAVCLTGSSKVHV